MHRLALVVLVGLVALGGFGCDETEKIVFRDRPIFNDPPDESSGFLGYFTPGDKESTCGQCHVGQDADWAGTAHADAYAGLVNSGHAQEFCFACHTVSELGNPTTEPAGFSVVDNTAYHDVQCESCHGPGLAHVENPDASQPLASLDIPAGLDEGCAECHQGTHHPFAEEWSMSGHAAVIGFAAGREECAGCHRGQGALEAWGVNAEYVEKDSAEHMAITCGVCHDPHSAHNKGQLRFPIDTTSPELHLCARCHDRRTAPDPASSHGLAPHSPETALLLGDAGWFPPGVGIDQGQIRASHGTELNSTLCAACHVNSFEVTDQETGEFVFNATGHLFTALPCVDANGVPVPGDCDVTVEARSFAGCTTSGCHGTEQAAFSALTVATNRLQMRADELIALLEAVDANLGSAGGEIDATNPTFTVAEGAFFNYNLATFGGSVIGAAAHNPFLTEGLLIASAAAVSDEYGVNLARSQNYDQEIQAFLERAGR